ncbi:MAG: mechanosensitive ion channel family protein [Candidatus Omnitrophica bacterium]|nr:mechanosensitive ion channel family protein [Candidatus Omnitrophota bacterium]MDD5775238.1 mechanosensitive ion channel family protein [Candidatus Omnitrophota bacterium]
MYEQIEAVLNMVFFGNSVLRYLTTLVIFVTGMAVIRFVIRHMIRRIKKLAQATVSTLDDFIAYLLEKIGLPFLYLVAVYLALKSLVFPEDVEKALNYIILGVVVFFVVRTVTALIGYAFKLYLNKQGGDAALEKSLSGIMGIVKVVVWAGAVIFFMDNLGFKISAVIAGLGIGGVAVALAAQTVLKDLFSYFCILFDHPFKVGDFVIIGDFMGTIEHVGIKTTRIRSLGGEMLVFSNSDLTDSRLRNYKLMERRRVVFKIGVVYQTPLARLKEIPQIIEDVIRNTPSAAFDRAHFFEFGDFSLIFEIVYYVTGGDYNKYMDAQQHINFAVMEEFEKRNIQFAYPTQTLFVSQDKSAGMHG